MEGIMGNGIMVDKDEYSRKYNERAGAVSDLVGRNMTTNPAATAQGIGKIADNLPKIGTSPLIEDIRNFSKTGNRLMSAGGSGILGAGAAVSDYVLGTNLRLAPGIDPATTVMTKNEEVRNSPVPDVSIKSVNPGVTKLLNEPTVQPATQETVPGRRSGWYTGIGGMDTSKLENPTEFMFTDASGKPIKPKVVNGRNDWSGIRDNPGGTAYAMGIGKPAATEESAKQRLVNDAANPNSPSRNQSAGILATMEGHKATTDLAKEDRAFRNELRKFDSDTKAEASRSHQEVAGSKMLIDQHGVFNDAERKELNMDLTAAKLAELYGTGDPNGYEKLNKYPSLKQAVVGHVNKFGKWLEPRMASYKSANPGMSEKEIRNTAWTKFNESYKKQEPVQ
jgi:hypothetical protein